MPHRGRVVERGTGDESDGNSMSKEEKWLKRAQEDTAGEGDGEEMKDAGGREEGCMGRRLRE